MGQSVEVQVSGQVTATVKVNLRQGAPSVQAPVLRKLSAGTTIPVIALVVGDNIEGNAHWYRSSENAYAWAGAFSALDSVDTSVPPVTAPTPAPGSVNLNRVPFVVDMSHGDGVNSFNQAQAAGLLGVIHKATTGASGTDDHYKERRPLATQAGLLWGAYHWGTAAPIDKQVDNFLTWADPDKDTLVALDYERDDGNQMTLDGAKKFLDLINTKLSRRAVLYSGDVAKTELGKKNDAFFGSHRLWLAQYGDSPSVQRSWKTYWLWQYTDGSVGPGRKTVPGLPGDRAGRLDCNYFAGSANDLRTQWAG